MKCKCTRIPYRLSGCKARNLIPLKTLLERFNNSAMGRIVVRGKDHLTHIEGTYKREQVKRNILGMKLWSMKKDIQMKNNISKFIICKKMNGAAKIN